MDVATITMDPEQAREKLRHYRAGVHRKADAEWERAADAYEQLAQGTAIVVLSEAIQHASFDAKGRPMLAIARADRRQVALTFDGGPGRRCRYCAHAPSCWNKHNKWPSLTFSLELTRPTPDGFN